MPKEDQSILEKVYGDIKTAIIVGELSQGEKLIESDLMEKFDTSRYTIREVIKKLDAEGYVETLLNRGAKVRKISVQEIEEVYEVLILLEPKAAELAALKRSNVDVDSLYKLLSNTAEIVVKRDFVQWVENNNRIHLLISSLCGNEVLHSSIRNLREKIHRHRFTLSVADHIEEYGDGHKKIIDSIAHKEPHQVSQYMKSHLELAKKNRINFLKSFSIT